MNKLPKHDTAAAVEFLDDFFGKHTRHLAAIIPDGPIEFKSFDPNEKREMHDWIEKRQGIKNLHYAVNPLKPGIKNRKGTKSDVAFVRYLHADVDNLDALKALRNSEVLPPTITVFSGGGYQFLWGVQQSSTDFDKAGTTNKAEAGNKLLAADFGGDHCHNVDRLLRIPGTINLPNAKKAAAGRVPVLAEVIDADWTRVYSIDQFSDLPPTPASGALVVPVVPVTMDELPQNISDLVKRLIETGDDAERPRSGPNPRYPSRSEAVYRVACALTRAGCPEDLVAGILLNPAYGISASILEKKRPEQYALRQARSAAKVVGDEWPDITRNGAIRPTMHNAEVALRRLGLTFSYDIFRNRKMANGNLLDEYQGEISDDTCLFLRRAIREQYGFDPRTENVRDAINALCIENRFHPIREMLDSLTWDGVPRLTMMLTTYFGAEDTLLNRTISRIMLIALVRRVRQPGVKFDQIIVLEGRQGTGKSTGLKTLAGPDNHSDAEILGLDQKTQMEQMEGVLIYEIGELAGFNKAQANHVKAFASRSHDRARMSYAHYAVTRPRQLIFIGTTNEATYLRDPTGNRRFWPVKTTVIDLEALERDRDQLLAEAAYWEDKDESIVLPEELWATAAMEQEARTEDDPWDDILSEVNGTAYGEVVRVSTQDALYKLGIFADRQHQGITKRLRVSMEKLGWKVARYRNEEGKPTRGYERPKPEGHKDDEKRKQF